MSLYCKPSPDEYNNSSSNGLGFSWKTGSADEFRYIEIIDNTFKRIKTKIAALFYTHLNSNKSVILCSCLTQDLLNEYILLIIYKSLFLHQFNFNFWMNDCIENFLKINKAGIHSTIPSTIVLNNNCLQNIICSEVLAFRENPIWQPSIIWYFS